jgi:uncharacterized protein
MHDVRIPDFSRIAQDLQIRKVQVESVVGLLDEGNTVPFITRYRKERTGGLNEEIIRQIQERVQKLRHLAERKQTILKSIEGQGKLTDELRAAIVGAESGKRLEDLYLPYKPRKRSQATAAREKGLEPLALAIWSKDPAVANLEEVWPTMVNPEKGLTSVEEVKLGVGHILAEQISDTAEVRAAVRSVLWDTGKLGSAKKANLADNQGLDYKDYFQFTESIRQIPPHRILAINRGEKEGTLDVRVEWDSQAAQKAAADKLPLVEHPHADFLRQVAEDGVSRLLVPSLEREIRRELTEVAEVHAVKVFARNLKSLLLQPPLRNRRVLAIDPGFRTGCKVAAIDEVGNLLEEAVIFPHPPQNRPGKKAAAPASPEATAAQTEKKEEPAPARNRRGEAKLKAACLVCRHQTSVIAIGNGTACRETEEFVSELIADLAKHRSQLAVSQEPPPAGAVVAASASHEAPSPTLPAAGESGMPEQHRVAHAAEVAEQNQSVVTAEMANAQPAAQVAISSPPEPAISLQEKRLPASVDYSTLPPGPADLAYVIVNEAGASVYSASAIGREEFPDYEATLRGTISIGRRLQDPLSELVKIDPQSIGVGLYQHDVNPKYLRESLDAIIESSVNHVGIDLNSASVPLLRHVSGLNQLAAREVVDFRKQHGPFRSREQLLNVPNIGPARYVQAAGFLKVADGDNPLDQTWIHPESYGIAERLLAELGCTPEIVRDRAKVHELREKLNVISPEEISARLAVGVPTLRDILDALARPGRDPREDLPPPIFKRGILKLEDLEPGMELKGTVLNVVDFGAFVDIGLKDSGLVHISQMANRYIKNPYDVVSVGDVVTIWVLSVDHDRRRVSLTMIKPGTERRPPERKGQKEKQEQSRQEQSRDGHRPRRGQRGGPRRGQAQATPVVQTQAAPNASTASPPAAVVANVETRASVAEPQPPPRQVAPPPRKPKRQPPRPKLSKDALERKVPLRSFGELEVFFEAREKEEPPSASP